MEARIVDYQSYGTLGLAQLQTAHQNTFEYLSGGTAIREGQIRITAIKPWRHRDKVCIHNASDHFVFFGDGDICDASLMLPPRSTTEVPVKCTEKGRQSPPLPDFTPTQSLASLSPSPWIVFEPIDSTTFHNGEADQRGDADASRTTDLTGLFKARISDYEDIVAKFQPEKAANGLAIFFRSDLMSIDLFNRTNVFTEYFRKILRAAVMELPFSKEGEAVSQAEAGYRTVEFLDAIEMAEGKKFASPGVGEEKRVTFEGYSASELRDRSFPVHTVVLRDCCP